MGITIDGAVQVEGWEQDIDIGYSYRLEVGMTQKLLSFNKLQITKITDPCTIL